jgi:3-oxoacyl-[acyl-carrier protein] reductase
MDGDLMGALDGRNAIVTGSGRGVGLAVATQLAAEGARVLVNDLDRDVAEAAAESIGDGAIAFAGDLTAEGVPDAMVAAAVEEFGSLEIVVNNAGFAWDGPLHKMEDRQFQAMLDIHTVVPFRVLRAAAPHLREPAKAERAEGREVFRKVVNVTSVSGTFGSPGQPNYAAAKAGLVGLTKTAAKEWGGLKVNVNAVAFGFVETRMTAPREEAETYVSGDTEVKLGVPAQMLETTMPLIPIGRKATPDEAAAPVVFLCSPGSNYIMGQVLTIGGGLAGGMTS